MASAAAAVRPHIITAYAKDGRIRCYVRSAHAADVYYRVEATNGRLTCTCPAGQQRQPCPHAASAASINAQAVPRRGPTLSAINDGLLFSQNRHSF